MGTMDRSSPQVKPKDGRLPGNGSSMELFDTTQIGLERALSGTARRQAALASNIANVNTPGYQRQDVDFSTALSNAWGAREAVESIDPAVQVDRTAAMRADGNSVDIDTEAAEQARTGLTSEAVSAVLKARIGILQSAIGTR
jgi:flagellar basal-body rod protein FlgB